MSLCCIAAAGQNKCNITGTVVDTKGEAISYASAVLYDDGKIATGGVTSDNGKFILTVDSSSKEFELSVELSLVLVFAMTSVFSWHNSVSLYPASFCTPRPNLPILPGVS